MGKSVVSYNEIADGKSDIFKEENAMALSNLFGWGKKDEETKAAAAACGAADETPAACGAAEEAPAACGAADEAPAACGAADEAPAACGAADEKPAACGTACGAGDKE